MINKNDYINLSQKNLDLIFLFACKNGDCNLVKYLLTSNDLIKKPKINSRSFDGFKWACQNNFFEIVQFLIFDRNIEQSDIIISWLDKKPDIKDNILKIFKLRALNNNLNDNLKENCLIIKKNKL